jgi:hypothetical protein
MAIYLQGEMVEEPSALQRAAKLLGYARVPWQN